MDMLGSRNVASLYNSRGTVSLTVTVKDLSYVLYNVPSKIPLSGMIKSPNRFEI